MVFWSSAILAARPQVAGAAGHARGAEGGRGRGEEPRLRPERGGAALLPHERARAARRQYHVLQRPQRTSSHGWQAKQCFTPCVPLRLELTETIKIDYFLDQLSEIHEIH